MLDHHWQACISAFLDAKTSRHTRITYASTVSCFLQDLGDSPGEVTDAEIAAFLDSPSHADHSRGQPISARARNRRRCILSAFYRFAQTYLVDDKPLYPGPLPACLRHASASIDPAPFAHFSPAWQRATEAFLSSLWERSGSDATVTSYRVVLRRFFVAPRTPEATSRADVLSFLAQPSEGKRNAGQPVAPSTRNNKLCVLTSFYKWASNWIIPGTTDTFLFTGVPPVQGIAYGRPGAHYRALSEEELEAFFGAIDTETIIGKRDFSLFSAFFALARRRSELYALKWGDIAEAWITDPKGQRHRGYTYVFRGKGHKRTEDVQEMPSYVYRAIVDYLQASGRYETIRPDDPVWTAIHPNQGSAPGSPTNRALNHHYVNLRMLELCRRAGIEDREGLSLHSWRHSSALARFSLGEDLLSLKKLLRHSNIATTDSYLRQLAGTADPGAAALERRFAFLR
jgi:integrase